ncbi:MAG: Rieske (2Fe-2S) protein [Rhodospirillaceae bacterium]|jgi:nitrite reductase/ring-hydroxylating ferredoxin subunit|nr:Rieske (2Fe-2S) protein [Rhodospirillaceae bacterium]
MTKICNLDDISERDSIGVTAEIDGVAKTLIVVRRDDTAFVYINSCPHIGAPLDLQPGKFLSLDKKNIICSTHGALFEIDTGHCIFGPCKDDHLDVLPVQVENGEVLYKNLN